MTNGMTALAPTSISRWWRVVGGLSMNLALGSLYVWSVFVAPLEKQFGWKRAQTSNVFTIAVVVLALTFILGGRLQDKKGPFWVSMTGAVLVSLGFFLCAYTHSLNYLYVCFGVGNCSTSACRVAQKPGACCRGKRLSPRAGWSA